MPKILSEQGGRMFLEVPIAFDRHREFYEFLRSRFADCPHCAAARVVATASAGGQIKLSVPFDAFNRPERLQAIDRAVANFNRKVKNASNLVSGQAGDRIGIADRLQPHQKIC